MSELLGWLAAGLLALGHLLPRLRRLRLPDLRCAARESGGFRCERWRGHWGGHSCRRALLAWLGRP